MAIVEMQKLKLVGLRSEAETVFDILTRSRLFEPRAGDEVPFAGKETDHGHLDTILSKKARCAFALNYILSAHKEAAKKAKKNPEGLLAGALTHTKTVFGLTDTDYAAVKAAANEDTRVTEVIDALEQLSFKRVDIRAKKNKLAAQIKLLKPYSACTDKFSAFRATRLCESLLVSGRSSDDFTRALEEAGAAHICYNPDSIICLYGVICLKTDVAAVREIIGGYGMAVCPFDYDVAAFEKIEELRGEITGLEKLDEQILAGVLAYEKYLPDIKLAFDAYQISADITKAKLDFYVTNNTYVLEGWLPKAEAEKIVGSVKAETDKIETFLFEPTAEDKPPTMYKPNKILAPYQDIATSYSPTSYFEPDPGIFTAFFFFLFFGMMTGDAGYGLMLALGTFLVIKIMKPSGGFRNVVMLFGISSISAIIWGILFGSVFGLSFNDFAGMFGQTAKQALWFNPLDTESKGPLMMLVISLLFGVIHMFCGFCIHFYRNIKDRQIFDALFDDGSMMVMYVGVFMLLLWMSVNMLGLGGVQLPQELEILLTPGLICFAGGLGVRILTKGRKKPNIPGKVVFGLLGLYDVVNILSDVLSYARIFGLTLASCAIGYAFNMLVAMIAGAGVIGMILAVVLAVVLHVFNFAMGLLSAYVHNARLQYLEFFGKFYEGGGRVFTPLGAKTKYINLR